MIDKREANRLRNEGLSLKAIGDRLGCTREYIRQITNRPGYRAPKPPLTPEQRANLAAAHDRLWKAHKTKRKPIYDAIRAGYENGINTRELGQKLGIGKNAVIGIAHRLGLHHKTWVESR